MFLFGIALESSKYEPPKKELLWGLWVDSTKYPKIWVCGIARAQVSGFGTESKAPQSFEPRSPGLAPNTETPRLHTLKPETETLKPKHNQKPTNPGTGRNRPRGSAWRAALPGTGDRPGISRALGFYRAIKWGLGFTDLGFGV